MRKPKITVIGAGDVGAATVRRLASRRLGELVVISLDGAAAVALEDAELAGVVDAAAGSDVIVVAAGPARAAAARSARPDADLVVVVRDAVSRAVRKSRDSIIVMVAEPADVMCEAVLSTSGFPHERVVGVAQAVDPALARAFAAAEPAAADEIARRSGAGPAAEPAAAAAEVVDAILNDRKRILPCFVCMQGELGVTGAFVAVPARVGAGGVEGVVALTLTDEERAQLRRGAAGEAARPAGRGRT